MAEPGPHGVASAPAAELTAALLRPLRPEHRPVSSGEVERLSRALAALVAERPGGGPFRLTDYQVRTALEPPGHRCPRTPFVWSPGTARRALGLAAVRSLVAGSAHSPVEAVTTAVAHAVEGLGRGRRPTSSMEGWLAGLSVAGRACVEADAVTWATRLWTGLAWRDFAPPPLIGRDHWWNSPHSSLLALRSRAEVRARVTAGREAPFSAHLVVLGGPRRASIRSELSVVALVEALRTSDPVPPGRIVGWWPASGRWAAVEVDQCTLAEGVATVARALAAAAAAGVAGAAA